MSESTCPHSSNVGSDPAVCPGQTPSSSEADLGPVQVQASASASTHQPQDRRRLVKIPDDINVIYAQPVRSHHKPYYDLKPNHLKRMNDVLRGLTAAGPTVEHGIVEAKRLLKRGQNPDLVRHALGIYLTHSADAQKRQIVVPPLKYHAQMLQLRTMHPSPITMAIVGGQVLTPDTQKGPAVLSYWREDYDYNDHHIHWHTVFPGTGVIVNGQNVSVIDRQGELFLYMHSQMVARYETEGLCWDQPMVRPWNQYDDVLEYGYLPMPGFITSYGGYPPYSSWYPKKNPNIPTDPDEPVPRAKLEGWRDNIYNAIKEGFFQTRRSDGKTGKQVLTENNCANLVGVVIEAEAAPLLKLPNGYSLDDNLYGNLHNYGHDKFAEISYHAYLTKTLQYGLMISNFGSPRDPAFWPWHKHVQYFGRLAAAKFPQDLTKHRAAVTLSNLVIRPRRVLGQPQDNRLTTFLGPPASNLMESMAKLDHDPYQWSVDITSTLTGNLLPTPEKPQYITLRFFIAAKQLMEDFHNWIEMDKITVKLTNGGEKIVKVRLDTESSVARKMGNYSEMDEKFVSSWCRCGWPQNMMLPVGKIEGMPFVAFCIATNDTVSEDVKTPALSYCGAMQKDRKYPDPRGMGYPFNRVWTQLLDGGLNRAKLSDIISDHQSFPFLTTTDFNIFRTTKPYLDSELYPAPSPTSHPTWFDPIKSYFKPSDVGCMKYEYGFDLSSYDDVMLHSGAIYDATSNKRMPLQMPPWTQQKPDPNHPMWTGDMCNTFRTWMLNGCPIGKEIPPSPIPVVPPPPKSPTWDNPIKGYFLPADTSCMSFMFDLSNHDSVKQNAKSIYDATSNKRMPLQMPPFTQENPDPNHPMWTDKMCDTFEMWINNGCP